MRESNLPYIGMIPESWKLVLLGQLSSEVNELNSECTETNALQFKMGSIISKSTGDSKYHPETLEGYKVVSPCDIIVNGLNLNYDLKSLRVGQVEEKGVITAAYIALRPKGVNPGFLKYLLKGLDFIKTFHGMGKGIRLTLSYSELKKMFIPVPSIEEQRRIAEFLDGKSVEIDTILEKTLASIEEYKKLKQAVITEAVTKGIRGNRPMKDSGVEWIGEIPAEWGITSLKRVLAGIQDGTHATLQRVDQGFPLLSAKNIQEGRIIIGDNESFISETDYNAIVSNGFPHKGDILFCCIGGSIGKCCMYDFEDSKAFQRSVTFIRTNEKAVNKYVYYLFLSSVFLPQYDLYSNVSAQAGIYMGDLQQFTITLPSFAEQQEIAAYLDEKCATIDSLIASKEALITELEAYKKSIIYEYVTGKKEVPVSLK